jgi:NAD(P)H-dependent flavin oxidoreductase YrpB (nitropropane dioxygenase family)
MVYSILDAGFDSFIRTTVWTGRPLRAMSSPYLLDWEQNRKSEINQLQSQGILVLDHELEKLEAEGKLTDEIIDQTTQRPMGYAASMVNKKDQTAGEIVLEMVVEAYNVIKKSHRFTEVRPNL